MMSLGHWKKLLESRSTVMRNQNARLILGRVGKGMIRIRESGHRIGIALG